MEQNNSSSSSDINCYFCNYEFDKGQLQDHLLSCGSILEQCPRRCGAWIQRKHKDGHVKECPKMHEGRSVQTVPPVTMAARVEHSVWRPPQSTEHDVVNIIEKELKNLNTRTSQEMMERRQMFQELEYLKTQYAESERRNQQLLTTIIGLRKNLEEEALRKADFVSRIQQDIQNLNAKYQHIEDFKDEIIARLESICKSILLEQNEREQLELVMNNQDKKNDLIYNIETQVNLLRNIISHEQASRQHQIAEIQQQLLDIGNRLADHRPVSRDLLEEHLHNVKLIHEDVDVRLRGTSDLITKHQLLDLELKQARSGIEEDRGTIQAMQKELRALGKSYSRLKNEFHEQRKQLAFEHAATSVENTSGHLIWRLNDYDAKMKDAVENDTILYSKLFRASMYGYTLQMELNLNGIGKWRGRHLTATVNVVPGDYDPLLEWPCDLSVDVIIRDQAAKRSEAMHIVKSLTIRKKSSSKKADYEEVYSQKQNGSKTEDTNTKDLKKQQTDPQKTSLTTLKRQYIFIPHTSLDKFDYVKNNTVFIEVVVSH